jgi:hypothetical protein
MLVLKQNGFLDAPVPTQEDAHVLYEKRRDESGEGASTFDCGRLFEGNVYLGRFSYNGRFWNE